MFHEVQGVISSINDALALKEQSTELKNEWIEELHLKLAHMIYRRKTIPKCY
jgi:hypothetical protein